MIDGRLITVAVPAHDEERLIARALAGIPASVDHIIVVDDASSDRTAEIVASLADPRIRLIRRERNGGVGAAIVTAYRAFLDGEDEICVVMAGDAQMDPADLDRLVRPVAEGRADYAKGNRLGSRDVREVMPRDRFVGNVLFTMLTKIASGYWHVVDSQCGYTAISRETLAKIDLDAVYERYGMPNDLLIKLNVARARVCDVEVRPIYGEEVSGIRPWTTIPRISLLLLRGFWWRMWRRHVLIDFHPLALLYAAGSLMVLLGVVGAMWVASLRLFTDRLLTGPTLLFIALLLVVGVVAVLFAMTFDMLHNADLKVRA